MKKETKFIRIGSANKIKRREKSFQFVQQIKIIYFLLERKKEIELTNRQRREKKKLYNCPVDANFGQVISPSQI